MASKGYPTDILAQATDILVACKQIDLELGSHRLGYCGCTG